VLFQFPSISPPALAVYLLVRRRAIEKFFSLNLGNIPNLRRHRRATLPFA
jgi:hypothetical protein